MCSIVCSSVYAAVSCPIHVRSTFTMSSVHFVYLLIFDVIASVISFSALLNANYIRCGDTEYTIHSTHTHSHTFTRSFVADTGIYSVCTVQLEAKQVNSFFCELKLQSNVINWHLLNFLQCLALHLFALDYYYLSD